MSDKELLTTLLGRGIGGESVMITAQRLMGRFRSIDKLSNASINDLAEIKGIGIAKATQIKAAFELGKRINGHAKHEKAVPFLKWAGGKGQLLEQYSAFFHPQYTNYLEPFLGGGAVYFHLRPQKAVLSDLNEDLINCYIVIKKHVDKLLQVLEQYQSHHREDFYYKIRERYNSRLSDKIERAAEFIYLNKTCYNGLYRVNGKGGFNVPFGGYKDPSIFDAENLRAISRLLKTAEIRCAPFEDVHSFANSNDFVYLDPPYYPINETSSFTSYTKDVFLEAEQRSLAAIFKELDKKGCFVMVSNSDSDFIKELYQGFRIETVRAYRYINCVAEKRGAINEIVIRNY